MVSLIIPCYNSEFCIERCITSILDQNYSQIELILINDGSTDSTEIKINQMKEKIEANIERFIYVKQSNQGVGAACNTGFGYATGEYLMLLDSDDMLLPDSIKKCVDFLEKNLSYALVRTNGYYVTESNIDENDRMFANDPGMKVKEEIFEDIFCGRTYLWSGTYMIRMNVLEELYPDHQIIPSRRGQNLQFVMMSSYKRKAGFIDEPLMKYIVRKESLSHFSSGNVFEKEIQAMEGYKDIRKQLIEDFMQDTEKTYWMKKLNSLYANIYVQIACKYKQKEQARKYYNELKKIEKPCLNTKIDYYNLMCPFIAVLLRVGRKVHILSKT